MAGAAIAGLGITELSKVYGRSAASLEAEAEGQWLMVRLIGSDGHGLRARFLPSRGGGRPAGEVLVAFAPEEPPS